MSLLTVHVNSGFARQIASLSLVFSFFIFFPAKLISDEISLSGLGLTTEKEEKEAPIDWSKPVVSRGFGLDESLITANAETVAQYKSGQVFYFFGEYKKAADKWLPLLEQQFAQAQASMGWLYQAGLGVDKDEAKAFVLYKKAAEQNNAVAQNNLGVMYENGIAVEPDFKKARYWYKLSAEQGYRFGQYNYANSLLMEKSSDKMLRQKQLSQAKLFLQRSADQGVKQAEDKLKSLAKLSGNT